MKRIIVNKYIRYLYSAFFCIIGLYFLVKGFYFFWSFYFAMGIANLLIFIRYLYMIYRSYKKEKSVALSKKNRFSFKGFIGWIAFVYLILYPVFTFIPGSNGYRPLYTYNHYNDSGRLNSTFPDEIPPNAIDTKFEYRSENIPGSCIKLSFKTDEKYIYDYVNMLRGFNMIVEEEQIIHNQNDRNFTNDFYVYIDEYPEADCCVYYTTKNDKHRDGVAVYNEQNIICFFDT